MNLYLITIEAKQCVVIANTIDEAVKFLEEVGKRKPGQAITIETSYKIDGQPFYIGLERSE